MRIQDIEVPAFGPFKDLRLELDGAGLVVIYGLNEAGKSSLLRGLRGWLFGVPSDSTDDFAHPATQVRVGGRLRHSNGTEIRCFRKKGRKSTLVDDAGKALDQSSLANFVGEMSGELFESVFGIDHDALVKGGRDLLLAKGEVGQSLFSAGLGLSSMTKILDRLQEGAQALYAQSARNRVFNKAIIEYKAAKDLVSNAALSGRDYNDHAVTLEKANHEREQVSLDLRRLQADKARLDRLHLALPRIAQLEAARRRLADLGEVRILPPDFKQARLTVMQKLTSSEELEATYDATESRLLKELSEIQVKPELIEAMEEIEQLRQDLGSCRKAAHDRTKLDAELKQLRKNAVVILGTLRPGMSLENAESLRLTVSQRSKVQELATQQGGLAQARDQARLDLEGHRADLLNATEELNQIGTLPSVSGIQAALDSYQEEGDLEKARVRAHQALERHDQEARLEILRLGLWSGTLDELEKLPVPTTETIEGFEGELAHHTDALRNLRTEIDGARESIADLEQQVAQVKIAGAVPTEEDLKASRSGRQRLWGLVRRAWLGKEDVARETSESAPGQELPVAYEGSVNRADAVGDHLRREANRVAQLAELVSQETHLRSKLVRLEEELEAAGVESAKASDRWRAVWGEAHITPLQPREMRGWLTRHGRLLERASSVRECAQEVARIDEQCERYARALRKSLEGASQDISSAADHSTLAAQARRVLNTVSSSVRRQEELRKAITTLSSKISTVQRTLDLAGQRVDQWGKDWSAAISVLGLGSQATPGEALAVLSSLEEFFHKVDACDGLSARIAAIQKDDAAFVASVSNALKRLAPDQGNIASEEAVTHLSGALAKATVLSTRKTILESELDRVRDGLTKAQATTKVMRFRLEAAIKQAGCQSAQELPELEILSEEATSLRAQITTLEDELGNIAAGGSAGDLIRQASSIDPDNLPTQLAEISDKITQLDSRTRELGETIGAEKRSLAGMDGESKAAELADQMQSRLATARAAGDRYLRLRMAGGMLRVLIEGYRQKNQTPVLTRSSEFFAKLTLGRYAGLEVETAEEVAALVGVRQDGSRLTIEEMSEGTRDQVYLSLRLASVDTYAAKHEPFPLIVDDVLVQFDDPRTGSTLTCLEELGRRNQVILFTHHAAVRDAAKTLLGTGTVKVIELQGSGADTMERASTTTGDGASEVTLARQD